VLVVLVKTLQQTVLPIVVSSWRRRSPSCAVAPHFAAGRPPPLPPALDPGRAMSIL
jgi:hypothetical protein